ncbi:restriction endonuclease [Pseudoduganella rivuli]|nr:restriction endonuclease [Pseudoduganella rivuli]
MLKMISRLVNTVRLVGRDRHHQNIRTSRKVLRAVRSFSEPGMAARCLAYLRQVEPAVFEEVVLSALEDAGLFVLRSRRYSGDGGIDGAAWLPTWGLCAIQIKRYRSHVCAAHVREFCDAVRRQSYSGGLFVHTGRSGASVYDYLAAGKIYLVSGDRLTRLVLNHVLEYGCLRKTSS